MGDEQTLRFDDEGGRLLTLAEDTLNKFMWTWMSALPVEIFSSGEHHQA
jgi:hypothetical protein